MPTFLDFSYYFTIKVLHVSKLIVGIGGIYMGLVIMTFPGFYAKYLQKSEYRCVFLASQILTIFSTLVCMV